ncbi:MAG TPA: S41 family peptidase [Bacteroidota bacterium]|nr:S41 family peptidase [Bacteroidota bacterium]
MKKRFSTPIVVLLVLVSILGGMQLNTLISGDTIYEQLGKFKDVLSLTEKYYVDPVDTQKLTESAIKGLLNDLDPHSVYIDAKQLTKVNEEFQGKFEGIGIEFAIVNDTINVVQPIGGGPSAQLGILPNDKIVKIDGKSAIGFDNDQVMKGLKGPKGTKVSVTIMRPGEKELLDYEIVRDVIPFYSVDVSFMLDDEVGYINVTRFAETTNAEMLSALQKLKAQGMKRLVLDLRFNPGGYLDQAVKMADLFLDGDPTTGQRKIVYTKGRRPDFNEEYYATTNSEFEKIPLIILVSNGTASASEIVAGAIQDWDRGLIVGETSFGKGLVQRQFELADKSAFRLTIARYYTPSGRLIQRSYAEGKEKYQREAFERKETEGENITHSEESDSTRPVFKTASGRKIYGGGGITPDYIVKPEDATPLTITIRNRNLFYEFTTGYLAEHAKELKEKYKGDFQTFDRGFEVDDALLNEFVAFVKGKKVDFNEEQFAKDKEYTRDRLKAHIARNFWGNDGWYPVILRSDNQLKKALSIFPEAAKIAKLQ